MNSVNEIADEIKRIEKEINNVNLISLDDVRSLIHNLTKLIYDHKMIGKIYDYYDENIEYYKQNKIVFTNIEEVVTNIAEFIAAFPNLTTKIEKIIVYKVDEDFFKVSKRLRYHGNNYGFSKYGPPTSKSLKDNCLSMSLMHLKRINGQWKITFEINNDSETWLEEIQNSNEILVSLTPSTHRFDEKEKFIKID